MQPIRRALISVSDKTGVAAFARALAGRGVEILSTGGTATLLTQEDIPVTERPYLAIARKLDIAEEALLETLRGLSARGVVRRFGATLRHQRTGYTANAMAAWRVKLRPWSAS